MHEDLLAREQVSAGNTEVVGWRYLAEVSEHSDGLPPAAAQAAPRLSI